MAEKRRDTLEYLLLAAYNVGRLAGKKEAGVYIDPKIEALYNAELGKARESVERNGAQLAAEVDGLCTALWAAADLAEQGGDPDLAQVWRLAVIEARGLLSDLDAGGKVAE